MLRTFLAFCFLTSVSVNGVQVLQSITQFLHQGQANLNRETSNGGYDRTDFDFIIVGGGTAGCALANRLSENAAWTVLLIEAGSHENLLMDIPMMMLFLQRNGISDWAYQTQPSNSSCLAMKNNQCNWPRGRVMGGSSVLNYMIYTRGNRKDYDRWAELGAEGWSFKDVLPYFQKLENSRVRNAEQEYAGRGGPLTVSDVEWKSNVARAFVAAGIEAGLPYVDYNGRRQVGVSYVQTTTNRGRRASSNVSYLYPIKGRPNLFVRKLALVTRVLIDPLTKTATGVEYTQNGRNWTVHAKREVILSAGAINSPQLLMLSGIGAAEHLEEMHIEPIVNLPAVGENLMDHMSAGGLTFTTNATTISLVNIARSAIPQFNEYNRQGTGQLASPGGIETLLFVDTDDASNDPDGYPDVELLQITGSLHSLPIAQRDFNLRKDVYDDFMGPLERQNANAFMVMPIVMRPLSRGRLRLASADPRRHPLLDANYFAEPEDMRVAVNGIKKTIALMETQAMRRIDAKLYDRPLRLCEHHGFGSDEYWECFTRHMTFTIYHYSGTCKMGAADDERAVVDPRLRVRGVRRLRVVDASIFPEIVTGHTSSGVYMVAEKAADMIKEDWL